MDGLQQLVSEFLGDHPEFIASVKWMDVNGERELMMELEHAGPAFCEWVVKYKGVPRDTADKLKAHMRATVDRFAA